MKTLQCGCCGESWKQTDCEWSEIERVKAEHLADSHFMERANADHN